MKLLIIGLSTRAIAESALLSGYDFITLDYFGDRDHTLLGNSPQTLRQVRHLKTLRSFFQNGGFQNGGMKFASTIFADEALPGENCYWLRKVAKSGGGHGIVSWKGETLARGQYLQEYIDGIPHFSLP